MSQSTVGCEALNSGLVELRTRVTHLETRSAEDREDLKMVIRRLDHLLWWLIGGLVAIIGSLAALAFKPAPAAVIKSVGL